MKHKLLIVDDEPTIRSVLVDTFSREHYEVFGAESANEALELLERETVDVVISDELMPGMNGSEFLSLVRKKYPDTIRMILTGHASLDSAIRAINEGEIYRFFTKPCNIIDLAITVRQALEHRDSMQESRRLLKVVKKQSEYIDELEQTYPGITEVKRDAKGAIVLDDIDDRSWSKIIDDVGSKAKSHGPIFPDRG
ncbi:MAG: response regulator [Deltaproteobacteria bacterium]|nr:response regulator [Deltaproteobacteria bacterium]